MRAGEHRRQVFTPFAPAHGVANLVDADRQTELAHHGDDQPPAFLVVIVKGQPEDTAAVYSPCFGKRIQPGYESIELYARLLARVTHSGGLCACHCPSAAL